MNTLIMLYLTHQQNNTNHEDTYISLTYGDDVRKCVCGGFSVGECVWGRVRMGVCFFSLSTILPFQAIHILCHDVCSVVYDCSADTALHEYSPWTYTPWYNTTLLCKHCRQLTLSLCNLYKSMWLTTRYFFEGYNRIFIYLFTKNIYLF